MKSTGTFDAMKVCMQTQTNWQLSLILSTLKLRLALDSRSIAPVVVRSLSPAAPLPLVSHDNGGI